jgi:hypothetical protein
LIRNANKINLSKGMKKDHWVLTELSKTIH